MTTSQPTHFLSEIVNGEVIPPEKLGYFRGRLSNRFHELVLELFIELERAGKITRAALARRIGKAPEQLTRWLGAPGNWTLDTISDLFLGMGYEPAISVTDLSQQIFDENSLIAFDDLPSEPEQMAALPFIYSGVGISTQQIQGACYLNNFALTAPTQLAWLTSHTAAQNIPGAIYYMNVNPVQIVATGNTKAFDTYSDLDQKIVLRTANQQSEQNLFGKTLVARQALLGAMQ